MICRRISSSRAGATFVSTSHQAALPLTTHRAEANIISFRCAKVAPQVTSPLLEFAPSLVLSHRVKPTPSFASHPTKLYRRVRLDTPSCASTVLHIVKSRHKSYRNIKPQRHHRFARSHRHFRPPNQNRAIICVSSYRCRHFLSSRQVATSPLISLHRDAPLPPHRTTIIVSCLQVRCTTFFFVASRWSRTAAWVSYPSKPAPSRSFFRTCIVRSFGRLVEV
jgi:hypothetical protein